MTQRTHPVFHRAEARRYIETHPDTVTLVVGRETNTLGDPAYDPDAHPHVLYMRASQPMTVNRLYDLVTNLKPEVVFYEPDAVEPALHNALYTRTNTAMYRLDDTAPREQENRLVEAFRAEYHDVLTAWGAPDIADPSIQERTRSERDRVYDTFGAHPAKQMLDTLYAEQRFRLAERYVTLMDRLAITRLHLPYLTLTDDLSAALAAWEATSENDEDE